MCSCLIDARQCKVIAILVRTINDVYRTSYRKCDAWFIWKLVEYVVAYNACTHFWVAPMSALCPVVELQTLIQDSGLNPHHYAADTQIYGFCSVTPSSCAELQRRISECIDGVASSLRWSRLQLNPSKTEIIWLSSRRRSFQLPKQPFRV